MWILQVRVNPNFTRKLLYLESNNERLHLTEWVAQTGMYDYCIWTMVVNDIFKPNKSKNKTLYCLICILVKLILINNECYKDGFLFSNFSS